MCLYKETLESTTSAPGGIATMQRMTTSSPSSENSTRAFAFPGFRFRISGFGFWFSGLTRFWFRIPGKANARVEFSEDGEEVVMRCIVAIPPGAEVQGYLAHKKTHLPRTLPYAYA